MSAPVYHTHSRIHPIRRYIQPPAGQYVYLKRDDELSSGITGSKVRKYSSLLPWLIQEQPDEVLIIGSAQSNNVSGLLQALKENGLPARLMLLESNEETPRGNLLWIFLLHGRENIIWVKREDWPQVDAMAGEYAQQAAQEGKKVVVIPEGCAMPQALPGAMTLADDILRNERESGLFFRNIFIDSGSGTAAAGLIAGLNERSSLGEREIHISLIAGTEESFAGVLQTIAPEYAALPGNSRLHFHRSAIAPSFGSITRTVLEECRNIARTEGVLMDPVYSVKHMATVRQLIESGEINGNSLIIYSGGSFGMAGFQEKLSKVL